MPKNREAIRGANDPVPANANPGGSGLGVRDAQVDYPQYATSSHSTTGSRRTEVGMQSTVVASAIGYRNGDDGVRCMTTEETTTAVPPLREARDLAGARHHITSVYIPHELTSHDSRRLSFKLSYLESRRLTLGHLRYGADVELHCPPMMSCYHVNLTLTGRTQVSQGGVSVATEGAAGGVACNFKDPYVVRWSPDAVQYAIKVPRASLEGQLASLIGRPVETPIRFNLGFDLGSQRGQSLLAAVRHLQVELTRPDGTAGIPLVRAQLESYVLSQMLLVIPHDYQHLLLARGKTASRRHVRIAMEFVQEHSADPITAADLAREACVSVRALQMGFREEFGTSPTGYIRGVRLDGVREELLARPQGVSITEIAHRWGFHHLGRFAEHYKRRFGELPSETV
ncbi:AraC family transcriptional regulator [Amycolatopsis thermoflava]|uniref:AraC family transcriptional regulator n=1 Tax=Amycolatopsis thermoflava TaxID=84480 RepID=UPI00364DA0E6